MVGRTTANCGYFLPSSPLMQILGIPSIQLEMMRWEGKLVLWPASGTMQHLDMGDLHPLHILSASIPLSGILGRNITLWICCNSSQIFSKGKVKTLNKPHLPFLGPRGPLVLPLVDPCLRNENLDPMYTGIFAS